jgi:sugar O-acyltransferase (sialic acid O-acetyltransferase NeuD family)
MQDIVIFGAGGLGKEVIELLDQINNKSPTWKLIGLFDDSFREGECVNGYPVLGNFDMLKESFCHNVVVAIGDPELRKKIILELISNKCLPALIHPSSIVPSKVFEIGYGSIIMAGVFISVNTSIGNGVLINVYSCIGHDVIIGDFCTINPGCMISGSVRLGDCVFAGVGSILNNNISIVNNVKIGAGAVVIKSVEKKSTVFGNPARIVL